jgi:hypothetical protein
MNNENNEEEKTLTPQEKLAEFQAQKMSRRQALGRFGFLAGAAAVAALSVDELTRLAGNEMSRRAAGNKAVEQVARELQNAGVAHALKPPPFCTGACDDTCGNNYQKAICLCNQLSPLDPGYGTCFDNADTAFKACLTANQCSICTPSDRTCSTDCTSCVPK